MNIDRHTLSLSQLSQPVSLDRRACPQRSTVVPAFMEPTVARGHGHPQFLLDGPQCDWPHR